MLAEKYLSAIKERAEGRYYIDDSGPGPTALGSLAPEALNDRRVVRLRRQASERSGWRTLLIAAVTPSINEEDAIRWAAAARDALTEPETADLYLILVAENLDSTRRLSIEADEQFCRRFVTGSNESIDTFLSRTFLTHPFEDNEAIPLEEPLAAALRATGESHEWLSGDKRTSWRAALLSGLTGVDLADALLSAVPTAESNQ